MGRLRRGCAEEDALKRTRQDKEANEEAPMRMRWGLRFEKFNLKV